MIEIQHIDWFSIMVTLSVLIPTRNNPHSCLKAIKYSILQINKNIEIVVSDNSDGKYQGVLKQLLQTIYYLR